MTRLEARFSKKRRRKETKKTIRAANGILKPRKIRACKTRISEHEPRKGTETFRDLVEDIAYCGNFRTRTPKGDGNFVIGNKIQ